MGKAVCKVGFGCSTFTALQLHNSIHTRQYGARAPNPACPYTAPTYLHTPSEMDSKDNEGKGNTNTDKEIIMPEEAYATEPLMPSEVANNLRAKEKDNSNSPYSADSPNNPDT